MAGKSTWKHQGIGTGEGHAIRSEMRNERNIMSSSFAEGSLRQGAFQFIEG
jgi:hypothetical protein